MVFKGRNISAEIPLGTEILFSVIQKVQSDGVKYLRARNQDLFVNIERA
jgi:hypothetical protein